MNDCGIHYHQRTTVSTEPQSKKEKKREQMLRQKSHWPNSFLINYFRKKHLWLPLSLTPSGAASCWVLLQTAAEIRVFNFEADCISLILSQINPKLYHISFLISESEMKSIVYNVPFPFVFAACITVTIIGLIGQNKLTTGWIHRCSINVIRQTNKVQH